MKGIMVPLLVFMMTGIVIAQQPAAQVSNSSALKAIPAPPQVSSLVAPFEVELSPSKIEGLKAGRVLRSQLTPRDPVTGKVLQSNVISGIAISQSGVSATPSSTRQLKGQDLGNGTLRFVLQDSDLADLEANRLSRDFSLAERGKYEVIEFVYATPPDAASEVPAIETNPNPVVSKRPTAIQGSSSRDEFSARETATTQGSASRFETTRILTPTSERNQEPTPEQRQWSPETRHENRNPNFSSRTPQITTGIEIPEELKNRNAEPVRQYSVERERQMTSDSQSDFAANQAFRKTESESQAMKDYFGHQREMTTPASVPQTRDSELARQQELAYHQRIYDEQMRQRQQLEQRSLGSQQFERETLTRMEPERLASERLASERQRLANERLANERLANERLASERLANERLQAEYARERNSMLQRESLLGRGLAQDTLGLERVAKASAWDLPRTGVAPRLTPPSYDPLLSQTLARRQETLARLSREEVDPEIMIYGLKQAKDTLDEQADAIRGLKDDKRRGEDEIRRLRDQIADIARDSRSSTRNRTLDIEERPYQDEFVKVSSSPNHGIRVAGNINQHPYPGMLGPSQTLNQQHLGPNQGVMAANNKSHSMGYPPPASINGPKGQAPLNNNNGGDGNNRGYTEFLLLMLIASLALNVYLAIIARGFYARYEELALELRDTFTSTTTI